MYVFGEQGWHSGESARLPPMCPGFDSRTRRHMWVETVVGSPLRFERFLSGYSSFPLTSKTNISKFQFDPGMHGHFKRVRVNSWCSVGKQITFFFLPRRSHTQQTRPKSSILIKQDWLIKVLLYEKFFFLPGHSVYSRESGSQSQGRMYAIIRESVLKLLFTFFVINIRLCTEKGSRHTPINPLTPVPPVTGRDQRYVIIFD